MYEFCVFSSVRNLESVLGEQVEGVRSRRHETVCVCVCVSLQVLYIYFAGLMCVRIFIVYMLNRGCTVLFIFMT